MDRIRSCIAVAQEHLSRLVGDRGWQFQDYSALRSAGSHSIVMAMGVVELMRYSREELVAEGKWK